MNSIKIFFFFVILAGLTHVCRASDKKIQFKASFDTSGLSFTTIVEDSVEYTEITLDELPNEGTPGYPSLPVKGFNISVPADASEINVDVAVNGKEKLTLPHLPLPAQYPALASIENQNTSFLHLISPSSLSSPVYNDTRVTVNGVFTIGGFNKVASVLFTPIMWNASDNSIELATDVTISLSWISDSKELNRMVIPHFQDARDEAIRSTQEIVLNPQDVVYNSMQGANNKVMTMAATLSTRIPYVIVTTKALAPSLERLAAFRRLRGIQTAIYTIEDILSDPEFKKGDEVSGLTDDAGKLRAFITYAYSSLGTQYVLLAGDYPTIPGRWATYIATNGEAENYVCDQYFRDLTTAWYIPEVNYTEPNMLSGISQDVSVGRLGLRNSTELDIYVDKLIQYEFNLKNIDLSYLGNAFVMCCSDQMMHATYDSYSSKYYHDYFNNVHELRIPNIEERVVTGKEALNEMKSDYWGFVDWRGHGNIGGVGTSMKPKYWAYGISGLDDDKAGLEEESPNGLDNWGNNDHLCWTLSMSCNLAEILEGREKYNFAESFILGKDYGGVSFIGNSGPGLIYSSSRLIQRMLNAVNKYYISKLEIPYTGKIFSEGLKTSSEPNHVKSTIGIIGDPLVPLWLKQPVASTRGDKLNPLNISGNDYVNYSKYYFREDLTENGNGLINEFVDIDETLNYTLLNSRTDMLPYIHNTRISSLSVENKGYWFVGKTIFSSTGDEFSLKLINNIDLSIEALGVVEIYGNLIIKGNSKLNIIPHKPLSIKNCSINSTGILNIKAHDKVEIGNGATINKGVTMIIKM